MIFTFYSYKGGVGRTMALANVAELLFQQGLKVLMVDFDLEAPGLERFFSFSLNDFSQKPGIIDMLYSYKKQMTQKIDFDFDELPFDKPAENVYDIYPDSINGKLWLLSSGKRTEENFGEYANSVLSFDWQDFYENWHGELYFEWLRREFEEMADIILIDSRTGVTEMGGVCTYQLADVIVMLCAPNEQNLEGTYRMAKKFTSEEVKELRPDRPLDVLIIPSRVDEGESTFFDASKEEFTEKFNEFPELLKRIDLDISQFWQLFIPYNSRFSYKETVAVRERDKAGFFKPSAQDMARRYYELAQILQYFKYLGEPQETPSLVPYKTKLLLPLEKLIAKDKKHLDNLEQEYEIEAERIQKIKKMAIIETDSSEQFKLEKQIEYSKNKLTKIEVEINDSIEKINKFGKITWEDKDKDSLYNGYNLLTEKIYFLRREYLIENDIATKFKIEKEIENLEKKRKEIEHELKEKETPELKEKRVADIGRLLVEQYDLLVEKITRLQIARLKEVETTEIFKLEKAIQEAEKDLYAIRKQIEYNKFLNRQRKEEGYQKTN